MHALFYTILPLCVIVILAAALAYRLNRRKTSHLRAALRAFFALILFLLLVIFLPEGGLYELLIALAAALALACILSFFIPLMEQTAAQKSKSPWLVAIPLLWILLMGPGLLIPFLDRINYAEKLAWSCDGIVTSKSHSANHNVPVLIIHNTDGSDSTFEDIPTDLFTHVNEGDHLQKSPHLTTALLNDAPVKIVSPRAYSFHQ